ncbi:hypothetical protein [Phormidium sp. CCY1219]|nr:hypothetical protein [Phormidium sp. CCY1219]MEB3827432.1 hypothetical protein [Phormidium sp. CCY1219]
MNSHNRDRLVFPTSVLIAVLGNPAKAGLTQSRLFYTPRLAFQTTEPG